MLNLQGINTGTRGHEDSSIKEKKKKKKRESIQGLSALKTRQQETSWHIVDSVLMWKLKFDAHPEKWPSDPWPQDV